MAMFVLRKGRGDDGNFGRRGFARKKGTNKKKEKENYQRWHRHMILTDNLFVYLGKMKDFEAIKNKIKFFFDKKDILSH